MPFDKGPLRDLLVDPDGVSFSSDGSPVPSILPPELKDLTIIEESMIARCHSKCWIVQLKEENQDLVLASTQRGMKGNIMIYPQQPSNIASILPPSLEEITAPVCVLFVGSSPLTPEWLRDHAKPLAVNATRVHNALQWLKAHNPLYQDMVINEECLQQLEETPVLPFNIEHISKTAISSLASLTSWARRERRVRQIFRQDKASFESRFTFLRKDVRLGQDAQRRRGSC
ncbi:hypothetical protein B0H13DRAFT_1896207 [Mycena leptocephala]|nr:hypothetical protein B0H13DRAFT_1896207 [Mycena leptocephala]